MKYLKIRVPEMSCEGCIFFIKSSEGACRNVIHSILNEDCVSINRDGHFTNYIFKIKYDKLKIL